MMHVVRATMQSQPTVKAGYEGVMVKKNNDYSIQGTSNQKVKDTVANG